MYDSNQYPIEQQGLFPQEEMLEIKKRKKELIIGIPKENHDIETRVPLTPQAVELLSERGHTILIESGAGEEANYSDLNFSEAGAQIISDRRKVFEAEIILKVAPFVTKDIELIKGNQIIISALHCSSQKRENIVALMNKKIKGIAFEHIKGSLGEHSIVRSMSEISGKLCIHIAAEYLSKQHGGKGVLLGGITGISPSEVIIIGAGTAAVHAAHAAIGLGAVVKIFDDSLHKLREIQQKLGQSVHTSVMQPYALAKALKSAEVVIGALGVDDYHTGCTVTKDMVRQMKKGSIIIDLNIDSGSCFETSKPRYISKPVFEEFGVLHYCVSNIAAMAARTASIALSNVLIPILIKMGDEGGLIPLLKADRGFRNGVYVFNGMLTSQKLGSYFGMNAKDINLLMAAF